MAETNTIQLADIIAPAIPPAAPLPYGWIAFGSALTLAMVLITVRLWWRRTRNRRAALTQLKHAEHALQQQTLEPRAAVFAVAQALRLAYSVSDVSSSFPRPLGERGDIASSNTASPSPLKGEGATPPMSEWTTFLSALDQARYAPHVPNVADATQLIAQARDWIARTPC